MSVCYPETILNQGPGKPSMQHLTPLNSKEIKNLRESLQQQFDYALEEDYAYLQNEKNRIFLINKDLTKIKLENLYIDKIGLYFAEVYNHQVRLSKEGAQLLAREAGKNKKKLSKVVSLSEEELKRYFQGVDLNKDLDQELGAESKLILLQYNKDILGCARYKEKKILNFMPKIHRGEVII